jgi:plasmid stabilization system protein ParE
MGPPRSVAGALFVAEVVWTDTAISDLDEIVAYIEQDSPKAAERMADKIVLAALSLETAPERGRQISNGRRELATVAPYLIRYRLIGEMVRVLEIRHGARRPD